MHKQNLMYTHTVFYKQYLVEVERVVYVQRTYFYLQPVVIPLFVEEFTRHVAKYFFLIIFFNSYYKVHKTILHFCRSLVELSTNMFSL